MSWHMLSVGDNPGEKRAEERPTAFAFNGFKATKRKRSDSRAKWCCDDPQEWRGVP
jgi:hypothetical protein